MVGEDGSRLEIGAETAKAPSPFDSLTERWMDGQKTENWGSEWPGSGSK